MVNRYTFKYVQGQHNCRECGEFTGIGIQTDKATGEDWFSCEKHRNVGKCRKNLLHSDFRRDSSKTPINSLVENRQNGSEAMI